MTRYVEYRYPFVFLPVSFWVSPKKEGGRKTITVTAHAASRLHGGGSLRRLLFKQTEPLNHKTREPHTARLHS
jgi:hypothetical protein